jgi:hypothetical protein
MTLRTKRRTLLALLSLAAATGLMAASSAFACIPIAVLRLNPPSVAPGGTVNALIQEVSGGSDVPPVTFHFKSIDGPVLATVQPGDNDTRATFTIPANTPGGDYIIYAEQPFKQYQKGQFPTWGMPAKAVIHVITPDALTPIFAGDAAVQTQVRPSGLVAASKSKVSAAKIVLIGLVTLVVAGAIVVAIATLGRKKSPAVAEGR